MSSHPNTLLVASIRPPGGQLDEFLETNDDITIGGVLYHVVPYEDTDLAIYPDPEYFCIYEYLTYGWGDTVELGSALAKIDEFKAIVEDYCEINNCTYKFHLTANFY